jgi:hypothetical protein
MQKRGAKNHLLEVLAYTHTHDNLVHALYRAINMSSYVLHQTPIFQQQTMFTLSIYVLGSKFRNFSSDQLTNQPKLNEYFEFMFDQLSSYQEKQ